LKKQIEGQKNDFIGNIKKNIKRNRQIWGMGRERKQKRKRKAEIKRRRKTKYKNINQLNFVRTESSELKAEIILDNNYRIEFTKSLLDGELLYGVTAYRPKKKRWGAFNF